MKILIILIILSMAHPIFSIKQAKFYYDDLKSFNILWGKTGTGKTFTANTRFYKMMCERNVRKKYILSGNTNESLYDNVITELLNLDMGINELEYKNVANRYRLINRITGTRAKCIGANNERAQNRIQGGNEDGWYADEVVTQPKTFVDMALSRLRYEKDGALMEAPAIWTLNPNSRSHYIKVDYLDRIGKINGIEYFYDFKDNPLIYDEKTGKFKGTFVKNLENRYSGVFKIRMIDGKWANAEGCIYDKFNRNEHVVKDYPKKQVKEYILGIDWGYATDHPLAILLIAVTDDSYYIIDEIYLTHQLIDKSLKEIMTKKGWFELPYYQYNEKEIFSPAKTYRTTISYAYADSARPDYIHQFGLLTGISTVGGLKSVDEGIQSVQRKLIKQGNGKYGLYILSKCVNTIREFELYRWDKKLTTDEGKDTPLKKDDHCPDAIRYPIFTRDSGRARQVKDFRRG